MTIVVMQSKVTGHWGYGPLIALDLLNLDREDKPTGLLTAEDAVRAALRDKSMPTRPLIQVRR